MRISESIRNVLDDPAALESLYRSSRQSGDEAPFIEAVENLHRSAPEHVLLQAWHHRLTFDAVREAASRPVNWVLAGALSVATGLVFWALSDENLTLLGDIPALAHLWAPIAVLFVLGFLSSGTPGTRRRALIFGGALSLVTLYVLLVGRLDFPYRDQYEVLILIHLPFLSWAAAGLALTHIPSGRAARHPARFAFIRKSLEVFVTGGLYLAAGMVFGAITVGLFEALDVSIPEVLIRLMAAGGAGLLPVLAVASVYDAHLPPEDQTFDQGVGRLVPLLTQMLLPLSLVVLLVYVALIPFNFYAPFRDREVLIVYNIMLFAVMILLIGITPIQQEDLAPRLRPWIRRGVLALTVLAVLVGLYALAAVLSRTLEGGWTANRITVIGWNAVNIGLLIHLALALLRRKDDDWTGALKAVFGRTAAVYVAWALALLLLLPLILLLA